MKRTSDEYILKVMYPGIHAYFNNRVKEEGDEDRIGVERLPEGIRVEFPLDREIEGIGYRILFFRVSTLKEWIVADRTGKRQDQDLEEAYRWLTKGRRTQCAPSLK